MLTSYLLSIEIPILLCVGHAFKLTGIPSFSNSIVCVRAQLLKCLDISHKPCLLSCFFLSRIPILYHSINWFVSSPPPLEGWTNVDISRFLGEEGARQDGGTRRTQRQCTWEFPPAPSDHISQFLQIRNLSGKFPSWGRHKFRFHNVRSVDFYKVSQQLFNIFRLVWRFCCNTMPTLTTRSSWSLDGAFKSHEDKKCYFPVHFLRQKRAAHNLAWTT